MAICQKTFRRLLMNQGTCIRAAGLVDTVLLRFVMPNLLPKFDLPAFFDACAAIAFSVEGLFISALTSPPGPFSPPFAAIRLLDGGLRSRFRPKRTA